MFVQRAKPETNFFTSDKRFEHSGNRALTREATTHSCQQRLERAHSFVEVSAIIFLCHGHTSIGRQCQAGHYCSISPVCV